MNAYICIDSGYFANHVGFHMYVSRVVRAEGKRIYVRHTNQTWRMQPLIHVCIYDATEEGISNIFDVSHLR